MTDTTYQHLLRDAWGGERVTSRGHACRRAAPTELVFRRTPLVSVRRTAWRQALQEFEWFMTGSTRVDDLPPDVRPWWSPWGDGAGYGRFATDLLCGGAFSCWDPEGPLPPCSYVGFAEVEARDGLHVSMYQRSCDLVCGAPHDWVQLWAYGMWLARRRGSTLAAARWTCVDPHVYEEHAAVVHAVLNAAPQEGPGLTVSPGARFRADDFSLDGPYTPAVTMRARLVV